MADVRYEDEKLLTSDEFIKTAKETADKNLQTQKDLAKDIYDSSYAALDAAYKNTEAAAATAKKRNLINADTEYKLSELKYGAAEEALAGAGLSGSGLSEYQRSQAYAKSRDEKQASYAEYDKIMRDAAYNRDQGKLTADIKYKQDVANADIDYNNTMTSLGEKELGYDTLEKQAIDSSYGTYIAGINDGSMTLDQIKADSYWSKLSEDQRKTVERAWSVKQIKSKIDNGDDIETIHSSYEYLELDEDGRNQVDGYHAQVEAGKTEDANAASGIYLEMAMRGMSIDTIKAQATQNGHYQTLYDSGFWTAISNEATKYANEKTAAESEARLDENFETAMELASSGWTVGEIAKYFGVATEDDLKSVLGDRVSQITQAATKYGDEKANADSEARKEIVATLYEGWLGNVLNGTLTPSQIAANPYYDYVKGTEMETALNNAFASGGTSYIIALEEQGGALTRSEAERELRAAGYGETDIGKIISNWQESNYKEYSSDPSLTTSDIDKAESNGMITPEHASELRRKVEETTTTTTGGEKEISAEDEAFDNGETSNEQYVADRIESDTATAGKTDANWEYDVLAIGPLLSMSNNLALTLNGTKYVLKATKKVDKNDATNKALNKLATGDPSKSPTSGGGIITSAQSPNNLVVYNGDMYVYSVTGWLRVESGKKDDVTAAIAAYLRGKTS